MDLVTVHNVKCEQLPNVISYALEVSDSTLR